ncbi:MAG: hypothetical protein NWF01_07910 [Candidatus Bathyarchaeota archaeon]|nr:hypothetical protein [Candidatus Bathyarchaeota archaeon]
MTDSIDKNCVALGVLFGVLINGIFLSILSFLHLDFQEGVLISTATMITFILAILVFRNKLFTQKEKPVSKQPEIKEVKDNSELIDKNAEFLKIQICSNRAHTILTIQTSITFVAFGLVSVFYSIFFQGYFSFEITKTLYGLFGICIIILFAIGSVVKIIRTYLQNMAKISDLVEDVNNGKPLSPLKELIKFKND